MNKINALQDSSTSRGFTLLETLFAVLLMSLAFGVFVNLMVKSYRATKLTQQNFIAVTLAQEGIDLMRNKRDNQVIDQMNHGGPDWRTNLIGTFQPDASNNNWLMAGQSFPGNSGAYICRVTTSGANQGKFLNCGGTANERVPGNFIRTVTSTGVSASAIRVDSRVTWNNNPTGITLSTFLYKVY